MIKKNYKDYFSKVHVFTEKSIYQSREMHSQAGIPPKNIGKNRCNLSNLIYIIEYQSNTSLLKNVIIQLNIYKNDCKTTNIKK